MEAGTDPASERAQLLARRWMELVRGFTGGDPEIERSLRKMWQQETESHGTETRQMRKMGEYISRAIAGVEGAGVTRANGFAAQRISDLTPSTSPRASRPSGGCGRLPRRRWISGGSPRDRRA